VTLFNRDKLFDDGQGFGHSVSAGMNKDVKGKTHTYYQVIIGVSFLLFLPWVSCSDFALYIAVDIWMASYWDLLFVNK
jgi:hypothetical protein